MRLNTKQTKQVLTLMVRGNILPVTECVLIESEGGKTKFTSTDLKTTVTAYCDAPCDVKVCVDLKLLTQTISQLNVDEFELSEVSNMVHITTDTGVYKMATTPHTDFPVQESSDNFHSIDFGNLMSSLSIMEPYTSSDDLRLAMTGIYLDWKNGAIVATDGHKICVSEVDKLDFQDKILPSEVVSILSRIDDTDLGIAINDRSIEFRTDNVWVKTTLIDAKYPAYNAVIPQTNTYTATIDRKSLISAVKRVKIYSSHTRRIDLLITNFDITISAANIEFSHESKEVVSCTATGGIDISVAADNLLVMLNTFESDDIQIGFDAPNRAIVARGEGKVVLVMPVMREN